MHGAIPHQAALEKQSRIAYLIAGFIQENLSEEEEMELDQWVQESDYAQQVFEDLTDAATVNGFMQWYHASETERKLATIKQNLQFSKPVRQIPVWRRAAAAAAVLFLLSLAAILIFRKQDKNEPGLSHSSEKPADIQPGQYAAVLRLPNGQTLDLLQVTDTLVQPDLGLANGTIHYYPIDEDPEQYEIRIPRKGFYQFTLPDSSRVWLNSGSSIRFPSRFSGPDRRVVVSGETFFEVAKDKVHPFIVSIDGVDVEATGTAFNIHAYPEDSPPVVTLVEGGVTVSSKSQSVNLTAGQQVLLAPGQWSRSEADVSTVTAWTRNEFKFRNATLPEVMRMVERWYDARVTYKDSITERFNGTINRQVPVSELLRLLARTGEVHFEVKDKEIIVSR